MSAADEGDPARPAALAVLAAGLLGFVVLAAAFVPWDPIPGGPLDLPAPSDVFTAAEISRAESYSRWARVWSWCGLAVSLVVLVGVAWSGRARRLVVPRRGRWWVRAVLAVLTVSVLVRLATLPFAVAGQVHRRRNGLSNQPWSSFLLDLVTGLALSVAVSTLVVLVVMGTARRWRRAWPVVAGTSLGALVLLGSFGYPILVEPLFNSFESLPDGDLRTQVLALADEEDVPVQDVLVADASRRTTTLNAYVSGFGSTRRIVLYDNLVEDLPEDQALSVVAHELAHARHRDVLVGSALGAAGALAGIGALGLLLGTRRLSQPAVVPVVLALVGVAGLVLSPVQNGISRRVETRADVDALRATDDAAAFVAMQRRLALRSLGDPSPPAWSQLWFGSHPTTLQRIAIARRVGAAQQLPRPRSFWIELQVSVKRDPTPPPKA